MARTGFLGPSLSAVNVLSSRSRITYPTVSQFDSVRKLSKSANRKVGRRSFSCLSQVLLAAPSSALTLKRTALELDPLLCSRHVGAREYGCIGLDSKRAIAVRTSTRARSRNKGAFTHPGPARPYDLPAFHRSYRPPSTSPPGANQDALSTLADDRMVSSPGPRSRWSSLHLTLASAREPQSAALQSRVLKTLQAQCPVDALPTLQARPRRQLQAL
ncbi:hypothetical protein PLICRDRAFT_178404 [Plicaturopsis crispa FD-325 SS-3]|nr:hypothetical protein PLICRDRAFT_178404 [Plicaturopsis crispa FD-325 SS-3]